MLRNIFFVTLAAAVAAGIGFANQPSANVTINLNKTPAYSGKQMYTSYCAPCHGVDGRGNGPAAVALKQPLTDLSALSRNNGGKFPAVHVISALRFGASNPAHGTAEMPVWGPILSNMDRAAANSNVKELRISNLSRYVKSLQVR
jgi:mono/diheme cytochrome c family protein